MTTRVHYAVSDQRQGDPSDLELAAWRQLARDFLTPQEYAPVRTDGEMRAELHRKFVGLEERVRQLLKAVESFGQRIQELSAPIPMRLGCPDCDTLHVDEGEFATKPHHTHACQECGLVWRPALVPTVGVRFLPGFKNQ